MIDNNTRRAVTPRGLSPLQSDIYLGIQPSSARQTSRASAGSKYHFLKSLQQLNNVKQNTKFHVLSYNEVYKLNQTKNLISTPKKPKKVHLRTRSVASNLLNVEYISLDPKIIEDSLPKSSKTSILTSEERQLIVDKYKRAYSTVRNSNSSKKLDDVWHQTLTVRTKSVERNSGDRTSSKSNLFYLTSRRGSNALLNNSGIKNIPNFNEVSEIRMQTDEVNQDAPQSKNILKMNDSGEFELQEKKPILKSDSLYNCVIKDIQTCNDLVKDFCKIVSHTQKSFQKADTEQTELYNFISVFVKEIDELEKIPREPKLARLNMFVTTIEKRIEDIYKEQDLIAEQISQINELISSSVNVSNISTFKGEKNMQSNIAPLQLGSLSGRETPTLSENFLSVRHNRSSLENSPTSKRTKYVSVSDMLTKLQDKTQELKSDVQKLRIERTKFNVNLMNQRVASARSRSVAEGASTRQQTPFDKQDHDNSSSVYKHSVEQEGLPRQSTFKTSAHPPHENVVIADLLLDRPLTSELNPKISPLLPKMPMSSFRNSIKEDNNLRPNLDLNIDEIWNSTVQMYKLFKKFLGKTEKKLINEIFEMNVFKKEIDENLNPDKEEDINLVLSRQIDSTFQILINEARDSLSNFLIKKSQYLEEILNYLNNMNIVAKSNSLKLKSIKNVVEASIKKVIQIDKYSKKYTVPDLEDKPLRQKFEKNYKCLKAELLEYRKTLAFLAQQFNISISMYGLVPIQEINESDLENIRSRSEAIWKTIYYINKLPQLEDEYYYKAGTAYHEYKKSGAIIEALSQFFVYKSLDIVPKLWEGEDTIRCLKTMHVKVCGLKNDFEMMSKVSMLNKFIEKPLVMTIKLCKRLENNEREAEKLLRDIQEGLTSDYNNLVTNCEHVEKQVSFHMNRFMSTGEHMSFSEWRQNHQIMATIKSEASTLGKTLELFSERTYPPRITLLPKPEIKKQRFNKLKVEIESVMAGLTAGRILGNDFFFSYFNSIKTSNIKEKLFSLRQMLAEELEDKQKIITSLDESVDLPKRVVEDIRNLLSKLVSMLDQAFELQDNINKEYSDFYDDSMNPSAKVNNQTLILDKQRDKYPKLISVVSLEDVANTHGLEDHETDLTQAIELLETKKNTSDTFNRKSVINPSKREHDSKIKRFSGTLKSLFNKFVEEKLFSYVIRHSLFEEMYNRFQHMYYDEIDLIEKVQSTVHSIQVNQAFFNKEIRPLTNLPKCINLLNKWEIKIRNLLLVKDWMINTLKVIEEFKDEGNIRGGIKTLLQHGFTKQKKLTNSIIAVIDIFSLGSIFNDNEIKMQFGHHLRVEEVGMEDFCKTVASELNNIRKIYQPNSPLVEEETIKLAKHISEFMETFLELTRTTRSKYKEIFAIISEGLKPHDESFILYTEVILKAVQELADTFCDTLNKMALMVKKPTWILKDLDDFYKEIILKDLSLFAGLAEISKEIEEVLKEFNEEFIEKEVKQRPLYKKIADSNPMRCDRRVVIISKIMQRLSYLTHTSEAISRPELKRILTSKSKTLNSVKRIYINFALIYSSGKNLNEKITPILETKELKVLVRIIPEAEQGVEDMVRYITKTGEDFKVIRKEFDIGLSFNFEKLIREDIVKFYTDVKNWLSQIRFNILNVVNFHTDLKKTFKGEILLSRDDWVSFIRDWISNSLLSVDHDLQPVDPSYQEFRERMRLFVVETQKYVSKIQNDFKDIVDHVQNLNDNFLGERFLATLEESKDADDKISTSLIKIMNNLRSDRYDAGELKERLAELSQTANKCDKSIKYLNTQKAVIVLFEAGVKGWDALMEYYKMKNMTVWSDLLTFIETKLIYDVDEEQEMLQFRDKVQTLEGLYLYIEQQLKFALKYNQKEFLSVIYEWIVKRYNV